MTQKQRGRKRAVITGANGGMGRALARFLGETMDLVLTDIVDAPLAAFVQELQNDGYVVSATITGDLCDPKLLGDVVEAASSGDGLGALVHTAALAPTGASWDRLMVVNLVATEKLFQAIDPILMPGSVVIAISSNAGYFASVSPEMREILTNPLDPQFLSRIDPYIRQLTKTPDDMALASTSYILSKWGVTDLCARRAPEWTRRGARLVSVSPGMVYTPMGRAERERNPRSGELINLVPAGRWATVMDIVATVRFLVSDGASFISGCDIRVDGAVVPALQEMLASE